MNRNNQKIEDFYILQSVVKGNVEIKDLDDDIKRRLINLCDERIDIITERVKQKYKKINEAEEILKRIKK